jgi:uncharacterized membrane protein YdjX (TVP38/TMEM64 family)
MTTRRWLLLLVGLAGLAAIAWALARVDATSLDPAAIAEQVRAAGAFGPIALLLLLVLQCVVAPLPSEPLMIAAGYVYGAPGGFAIAWLGVVVGALLCYALARTLGRGFVARFVSPQKLSMLDTFEHGSAGAATFLAILSLRLFAFTAFDVISYACGLIRFPFLWFVLATGVGAVPKVFAFTYFGANVGERPGWLNWLIAAGTFGALLAVPWLVRAWRRGAAAAAGKVGG